MAGNTFGTLFKVTTFGETHGTSVGCIIDGCPAGLLLSASDIQRELDRRRPGQSTITTQRKESDIVEIHSGVFEGKTTGTPIMLMVKNADARSHDYDHLKDVYRPSHADFTYAKKFGIRDHRGGGRASARETLARVAAGAVAKKILAEQASIEIVAYVERVQDIDSVVDINTITQTDVESTIVRCPDIVAATKMIEHITSVGKQGDSVGGIVRCVIRNTPPGLGEPVFDKVSARLGSAMLSLPAVKGFEIGSGFAGTLKRGSEHNDSFFVEDGTVKTRTNNSGGIQGGISNGEPIHFRVAFKPTSTIAKEQETISSSKKSVLLRASGRHDPCVLPRAVPIVEAMAALTMVDLYLLQKIYG
ncbi:MAG: chorismate synthase [Candidatus Roizmanbacteria bacterium]